MFSFEERCWPEMLILSRKARQQIVIDDNIVVSVMRLTGNQVSIGIEAPESVHIIRGELPLLADHQARSALNRLPDGE